MSNLGTLFHISTLLGKIYFCSYAMQKIQKKFGMAKLLSFDTHSKISNGGYIKRLLRKKLFSTKCMSKFEPLTVFSCKYVYLLSSPSILTCIFSHKSKLCTLYSLALFSLNLLILFGYQLF